MGKIMEPGLYNMDCMEAMKQFPDGFFDLAIVDPPYGGGYRQDDDGATTLRGGAPTGSVKSAGAGGSALSAIISATRTGGTWATKYRDRRRAAASRTGTWHRRRNTSASWPG